jgi:hypothetical protein
MSGLDGFGESCALGFRLLPQLLPTYDSYAFNPFDMDALAYALPVPYTVVVAHDASPS